jgi:hypothetical protein
MIILLNNNYELFVELTFEKGSKIVKTLIDMLKNSNSYKKDTKIQKILCHIFLDEYKELFFNYNLENLFILNNEKFTKVNTEGLDKYPKVFYQYLLVYTESLKFSYDCVPSLKNTEVEERYLCKFILIKKLKLLLFKV